MSNMVGATGSGDKNATGASAHGMGGMGLTGGMDALRKSIEALDKSLKSIFVGDDPKAESEGTDKEMPMFDKGVLNKGEGKEPAKSQETSPLIEFNAMIAKSTEALRTFRDGLGLPSEDGTDITSDENGFDGVMGIMSGEGDLGGDGETPLTAEEEVAKAQETADQINAIEDEKVGNKEANNKTGVADEKMTFDKGFSQAQAAAKKLGLSEKHTAAAGAIVSTARAIAKANEKGFPANIPLMAQAAATGAMQLGVIKGQFHGGIDEVPSSGTYLLEKGERVVDKRLNADLKGALDGKQGGGSAAPAQSGANVSSTMNISFNEPRADDPDAMFEEKEKFEGMLISLYDEYAIPSPFDD